MIDTIQHYLYQFSNALLIPTLVMLMILTAWMFLLLGGMIREFFERGKITRGFGEMRRLLKSHSEDRNAIIEHLRKIHYGVPSRFYRIMGEWSDHVAEQERCLGELESEIAASMSKLTWLTRTAPMLGLMGTLIPLGPALTGLASGNMATLSSHLVVAFTATVIGVLIGCVAYTINVVRRNWYERDMMELEYLIVRLNQESSIR